MVEPSVAAGSPARALSTILLQLVRPRGRRRRSRSRGRTRPPASAARARARGARRSPASSRSPARATVARARRTSARRRRPSPRRRRVSRTCSAPSISRSRSGTLPEVADPVDLRAERPVAVARDVGDPLEELVVARPAASNSSSEMNQYSRPSCLARAGAAAWSPRPPARARACARASRARGCPSRHPRGP